jgi:hypothetical protein
MNGGTAIRARALLAVCALTGLALTAGLAAAQVRGTISGYVKDPTEALLPGARVTLRNEQTGALRETTYRRFSNSPIWCNVVKKNGVQVLT